MCYSPIKKGPCAHSTPRESCFLFLPQTLYNFLLAVEHWQQLECPWMLAVSAKLGWNKPFDTDSRGHVNHPFLQGVSRRVDRGDDGILATERLRKLIHRVSVFDAVDLDDCWEERGRGLSR